MHVDLVKNNWYMARQILVERIEVDDHRAKWDGDYLFATEAHEESDCPFKDSKEVEMR